MPYRNSISYKLTLLVDGREHFSVLRIVRCKKKISIDNKDYVNQSKGNLVWEKFKMWTDKHLTLFIWKTRKSSLEYKICTAFKRETNFNENENELVISYMTYDMTYSRPPPNLRFYHHAKFVGQPKNTVFQW